MNAASKPQNTNFYANITQTSEKRKTCFSVFYSECSIYSRFNANEHKLTLPHNNLSNNIDVDPQQHFFPKMSSRQSGATRDLKKSIVEISQSLCFFDMTSTKQFLGQLLYYCYNLYDTTPRQSTRKKASTDTFCDILTHF